MSNPWAGQMVKHITSRRRPRWFWNLFFGVAIFLILISFLFFIYNVLCDHSIYESEQIFIACQETNLITDIKDILYNHKSELVKTLNSSYNISTNLIIVLEDILKSI